MTITILLDASARGSTYAHLAATGSDGWDVLDADGHVVRTLDATEARFVNAAYLAGGQAHSEAIAEAIGQARATVSKHAQENDERMLRLVRALEHSEAQKRGVQKELDKARLALAKAATWPGVWAIFRFVLATWAQRKAGV